MIELPSAFWSGWVLVLTVGSLAVLVWLIISVYSPSANNSASDGHEQVWDENLREGTNPAPLWWFWLIFVALIFSAAYLLLYPGLGSFQGALKWSQSKRLAESTALHELEFKEQHQQLSKLEHAELAADPQAMKTAAKLFANHCAACHGTAGQGQAQFPNLTDAYWQWGGDAAAIETTIKDGRIAVMPAWSTVLDDNAINAVAHYVRGLGNIDGSADADNSAGADIYARTCASCHGAEGQGNALLGAPAFTDDEWLYGASLAAVRSSISLGRQGEMPAQAKRLSEFQIAALTAWLSAGRPSVDPE